ncbi:heme/hemin ABC transporter substrate-binding protein [Paraglaciecola arctica]|uniref:Iron complex transport system substrate-binding protein n=1 Tax=Paraglaciecola arctica BSs20135 TaxID=493475 RepID=K6YVD0_9ALTE|nr:ABC transporter substrate-binding protein [Paraglaciecola arctica]GAC22132.1 iron complex transport system substrate-binding protein [Paraglaciecola arctica BSs20135]
MYKLILIYALVTGVVNAATDAPKRIISSGGSITEIIYALGKQELIVATDSTSLYPMAAVNLPKLGYFRQLSTEGVLSFQPSHLIGAHATGPASLAGQLEAAGVQVNILGEQRDLAGLTQLIEQVGKLLGAENDAFLLVETISQQVTELKLRQNTDPSLSALFVMSDSERGLTVAGNNTVPQALFDDAGIHNVAAKLTDYKVMDNESILAANPDLIFVASHRIKEPKAIKALCQHPALKATTAGRNCSLVVMESSNALGLSPRYPQALATIISSIESLYVRR